MSADQLHTVIGWVTAGAFIVAVTAAAALVWTNTSSATYARSQRARAEYSLPPSQVMGGRSRPRIGDIRVAWPDTLPPAPQPDPATIATDAQAIEAYAEPGTGRHAAVLPPTVDLSQWGAHDVREAR